MQDKCVTDTRQTEIHPSVNKRDLGTYDGEAAKVRRLRTGSKDTTTTDSSQ